MLVATSAVRTDATGASLTEFRREFERMHQSGVSADELTKAVETRRRRVIETFETTDGVCTALSALVADGRPLDAYTNELAALESTRLEAVNRVATSGIYDWDDLLVVLVGDREAVLAQLRDTGFPEPEEADPEGRLKP